jgi:hypothetical protein
VAGSEKFLDADGKGVFGFDAAPGGRPAWPAYDTNFKMNPPLGSARDREAVLEGLADGTMEILCSDHAPHCDYEKEVEFDYAPFGITGLETELALSLMQLYHTQAAWPGRRDCEVHRRAGPAAASAERDAERWRGGRCDGV